MNHPMGFFAVITAPMLTDDRLCPNEKLLLAIISSYTQEAGYCWASNSTLAARLGVAERSVGKMLRTLEKAGYLRRDVVLNDKGEVAQRRLWLQMTVPDGCADPYAGLRTPLRRIAHTPTQDCVVENKDINNIPPITPQRGETAPADDLFEQFWAAYPRHVNKAAARKAFGWLKPTSETVADWIRALNAQKQTRQWREDGGRYIPHASTWLNGAQWENDLSSDLGPAPGDCITPATEESQELDW